MKPAMTESSIHPCLGRVKNGVIIIDTPMTLPEGQPVRIEPLALRVVIPTDDRLERMKTIFARWDAEDSELSDDESECLQLAIRGNRGILFRTNPPE